MNEFNTGGLSYLLYRYLQLAKNNNKEYVLENEAAMELSVTIAKLFKGYITDELYEALINELKQLKKDECN